ncbi:hypothetical protein ABKN59_008884 [Abortiporus biennis]
MESTATKTIAEATSDPTLTQTPPIVYFLQLLKNFLPWTLSLIASLARTFVYFFRVLLWPIPVLVAPILYLLAPVYVLLNLLVDILILTPYRIIAAVAYTLYPLYVLIGIACICAGIIGITARYSSYAVIVAIMEPSGKTEEVEPVLKRKKHFDTLITILSILDIACKCLVKHHSVFLGRATCLNVISPTHTRIQVYGRTHWSQHYFVVMLNATCVQLTTVWLLALHDNLTCLQAHRLVL